MPSPIPPSALSWQKELLEMYEGEPEGPPHQPRSESHDLPLALLSNRKRGIRPVNMDRGRNAERRPRNVRTAWVNSPSAEVIGV